MNAAALVFALVALMGQATPAPDTAGAVEGEPPISPAQSAPETGMTVELPGVQRPTLMDEDNALLDAVEAIEDHLKDHPLVYGGQQRPENALVLTDRRCVALALENNAQVYAAGARVDAARARIGQAQAERWPKLDGRIGYTHTGYNQYEAPRWLEILNTVGGGSSGLGGGGLGGGLGGGNSLAGSVASAALGIGFNVAATRFFEQFTPQTEPDDDLITSEATIRQVLYTGGQLTAGIRASKFLAESEAWQRQATLADIEFQAKQAFYDALLTDALVRVAEESVKTFSRTLADAEEMFEVGMVSHFEVLRAETELGARKAQVVAAHNGRKLAFSQLRRVLSIPQDTPIALDPVRKWTPMAGPVEAYINDALAVRPELKALDEALSAAEQDLRRVKGSYLPQVAATATYRNVDGGGLTMPDGWELTVGAEWEIAAGGRRGHETAEKNAAIRELEYQRADLERLIELDVTQAHIQIEDAMAQVQSERGTVELAQEGLRLAELRFQEGVGTQSEVLDAELALTNAESNLISALRDFAVATAALERATASNWFPSFIAAEAQEEPVEQDG